MPGRCVTIAICCTAGSLLVAPAAANAAPMDGFVGAGLLDVETAGGDSTAHVVTISYAGGAYRVDDTAGINPGAGCSAVNPNTISCGDVGISAIVLAGGIGPDKLTIASTSPSLNSDGSFSTATGIFGGPGDDNIVGSDLVDLIRGGDGNDTMDGRLGGDGMNGQHGIDTVTYASRPASQPVLVDQRIQGNEEIQAPSGANGGAEGDDVEAENVTGTPGNDTIIGFGEDGLIHDNGAANTFTGLGGNDTLIGGIGADHLLGGPGNDRLLGQAQKDTLVGGGGRDLCNGGSSKDHAKGCERKRAIP